MFGNCFQGVGEGVQCDLKAGGGEKTEPTI